MIPRNGEALLLSARRTTTSFAAVVIMMVVASASPSRAQVQVKSSNVKCRNHIGSSARSFVKQGFRLVDDCYAAASSKVPCDHVEALRPAPFGLPSAFSRATDVAAGITNVWCVQEPDILANYPAAQIAGQLANLVGPQVRLSIDASAATLQGPFLPGGKGRSARLKRHCIRTIGRVRSKIVNQVLGQAVRCQRAIDRTATSFGLISPTCLVPAPHAAARSRTIVAACASFTGPDVGSCSPLPTCVVASATQTGHDLATATYGFSPSQQGDLCGNGKIDPGESCDEGAANSPTGACTDQCETAACGDGKIEAGGEECDPGSQPGSTSPKTDDPNCNSDCKLTRCGDGIVQTGGNRPDEQCDDGNNVAGDGCSPTCQFETVSCPVGGTIDVTVTFVSSTETFSSANVAGIDLSIGYPSSVSFPGSQFLPVEDPSDPASRLILLGGPYNLYDGTLITFFDYDTSIRTVVSGGQLGGNNGFLIFNFPEIPFERIKFDCVSDAPLTRAAFPCTISKMVNQIGGDVPPSGQPECKVTLPQ